MRMACMNMLLFTQNRPLVMSFTTFPKSLRAAGKAEPTGSPYHAAGAPADQRHHQHQYRCQEGPDQSGGRGQNRRPVGRNRGRHRNQGKVTPLSAGSTASVSDNFPAPVRSPAWIAWGSGPRRRNMARRREASSLPSPGCQGKPRCTTMLQGLLEGVKCYSRPGAPGISLEYNVWPLPATFHPQEPNAAAPHRPPGLHGRSPRRWWLRW